MGFEPFIDEESGRPYLHNSKTGETKWEKYQGQHESQTPPPRRPLPSPAHVPPPQPRRPQNYDPAPDEEEGDLNAGANPFEGGDETGLELMEINPNATTLCLDADASDSESPRSQDGVGLLSPPGRRTNPSQPSQAWHETVVSDDNGNPAIIRSFPCLLCFHSFCCEGPVAVFEGLVKAPLYIAFSLLLFLLAPLTYPFWKGKLWNEGKAHLREGLLFLAAALTLSIPCSLTLTVYSKFTPENDWNLSPIPTLLGPVDPRRFSTLEGGDGALAANCFYRRGEQSLDAWQIAESLDRGVLYPPGRTWDDLYGFFNGVSVPDREGLEVELEKELDDARRGIRTEKSLEREGFVRSKF